MPTTLETLPDELLLMIYGYLEPYHILFAFIHLNERFELTLERYKRDLCPSDMRHADTQYLNNELISLVRHSVTSLTLNDEFTGGLLCKHFFQPIYPELDYLDIQYSDGKELSTKIRYVTYMPNLKILKIGQIADSSDRDNSQEEKARKTNYWRTFYTVSYV